jgi:predicted AlkP superfamily phosphohydrolase/phosphomutase
LESYRYIYREMFIGWAMKKRVILIGFDALVPNLVEKFSEEKKLPHISEFMSSGAYAKCLPCFPGMTPQNWTTIATGAYPGTHGITDFNLHKVGEPLEGSTAFRTSWCKAEYIWDVADRHGKKCLLVNYIASYPPTITNGIFIGGEPYFSGSQVWPIRRYSCFVTKKTVVTQSEIVQLNNAKNWTSIDLNSQLLWKLEYSYPTKRERVQHIIY